MKPALSGHIHIENAVEYETALMAVERLMEVAEDSALDPLDPLIELLFAAIQAWEARDPQLADWDNEDSSIEQNASPANKQHLERAIAKIKSLSDVVRKRFAAIPEQEKHGDLIDGETFFQLLDEPDRASFEAAIKDGLLDLKEGRVISLDAAKEELEAAAENAEPSPFENPILTAALNPDSGQGYWLGHVGLGVEDASLMRETHLAEFHRLIASGELEPAGERYVLAVQQRLMLYKQASNEVLVRVRLWFASDADALRWYLHERLPAFGKLTPAEVVKRWGEKGVKQLLEYAQAKELGGFE